MNEVVHMTTEYTPLELHSNVKPVRFWNRIFQIPLNDDPSHEYEIEMAKQKIRRKGRKRSGKYNSSHKMTEYHVGQKVLVRALNVSNKEQKLSAKFFAVFEGPYMIINKFNFTYIH